MKEILIYYLHIMGNAYEICAQILEGNAKYAELLNTAILGIVLINTLLIILILFVYDWYKTSISRSKELLDSDAKGICKRTDFPLLYRHCLGTIAEGYNSRDKDKSFGHFLNRHAGHLSKHHHFPNIAGKRMILNPILYCTARFEGSAEFLDTLLDLYIRTIRGDLTAAAEAKILL